MANAHVNKVVLGNETLIDLTADTVTAAKMLSGTKAHDKSGAVVTGSIASKAAATYNTSSSDQSIASGQYLNGAQTIKAVTTSNISAENIKAGVNVKVGDANSAGRIANVTGTFTADATATASDIKSGKTAYVNGNKVTGTAEEAFAVITALYPAGAVCTCSLGAVTITADDTSGEYNFMVPTTGNWVVSASGRSVTININRKNQHETARLNEQYFYKTGEEYIGVTGGWEITGPSVKDSNRIRIIGANSTYQDTGKATTKNLVNLQYDTLHVNITGFYQYSSYSSKLYIIDSNGTKVITRTISGTGVFTVDISSLRGEYKICIAATNTGYVYLSEMYAD